MSYQVGLLLEAPFIRKNANRVLLTIDITTEVADEALSTPTCFIVSYHPTIFKPLSSITLSNPLQRSLLRLAAAGISVYCPHTALDSVNDGINDWLAAGVLTSSTGVKTDGKVTFIGETFEDVGGQCRLVTLADPISMEELQTRIKKYLKLQQLQVGYPAGQTVTERRIKTIAICAGAGGSFFGNITADAFFTGEMSHHEVLAAVAKGSNVILCGHTNTERGYLPTLAQRLKQSFNTISAEDAGSEDTAILRSLEIEVSKKDKHPLQNV
ncbi:hypothetical protein PHLGIDRAFT_114278 [Phlebiopsis gigantea 11061_1 CR5-6]|uniref:Uncharacterized protein n=1 Tax=Phlebiopsis gigantea (strain 11061_1 CR5-6) TaxID=745531 RepID=A0A0C3S679_PHLG1|nr:hypothetical protein PHLGIDRAFT_114278 [Phlebiopsis gigantea 11061_1 CR5-6]